MKIGFVDLDTSHPQNWIPLERELGHTVAGVWDGGTVHPPDYVRQFAQEHKIPQVYHKLEDMVGEVDCAVLHGCDWDTHIAKARPFVEAGKAVLIDKPLVGKLRDLRQLESWAQQGARITGGSSLLFCNETREWLTQPLQERGTPHTVFCGCGVDEFNYGIHAYSMLAGIVAGEAAGVRHLGGGGGQRRVQIDWPDGRLAVVACGAVAAWLPFYATVVTERSVIQYQADSAALYRALLEVCLPYLAGETAQPPVGMRELIQPELWALAARRSWLEGNRRVNLAELSEEDEGYDGQAFGRIYRKQRYG